MDPHRWSRSFAKTLSSIASLGLFILLSEYASSTDISGVDLGTLLFLNGLSGNSLLDNAFLSVTQLGSSVAWLAFAVLAATFSKGSRLRAAILLGVTLISSELLETILKPAFQRERPFEAFAEITVVGSRSTGYSFPSGHALRSFAGSMMLMHLRKHVGYAFLAASAGVAISRVYLGVHYPSDVLGSFFLAYFVANSIILAERVLVSRYGAPKPSTASPGRNSYLEDR